MYSNNSGNPQSEADKIRKRHTLENEIIMKDSDLKKNLALKDAYGAEIRKLKRGQDRLHIAIQQKEADLKKLEFSILQEDAAIKKLKKELNLL